MNGIIELVKVIILGIVEGGYRMATDFFGSHMFSGCFYATTIKQSLYRYVLRGHSAGAILAVMVVFFHKLNPLSPSKSSTEKKNTWLLWSKVIVATMPALFWVSS